MSVLSLFPSRIRFVDANGLLTKEAVRALTDIYARLGGPSAPTITELSIADDEDSGLEEIRHETAKALDALAMRPLPQEVAQFSDPMHPLQEFVQRDDPMHPLYQEHSAIESLQTELAGLREMVAEMRKEIEGLQQGNEL